MARLFPNMSREREREVVAAVARDLRVTQGYLRWILRHGTQSRRTAERLAPLLGLEIDLIYCPEITDHK